MSENKKVRKRFMMKAKCLKIEVKMFENKTLNVLINYSKFVN